MRVPRCVLKQVDHFRNAKIFVSKQHEPSNPSYLFEFAFLYLCPFNAFSLELNRPDYILHLAICKCFNPNGLTLS